MWPGVLFSEWFNNFDQTSIEFTHSLLKPLAPMVLHNTTDVALLPVFQAPSFVTWQYYRKRWKLGLEKLHMRLQLGSVSAWTVHVWHWYLIRSCELHLAQGLAVYPNSWVCWIWEHCISYSDGQWVVHRVLLSNKTITTSNISFLQSSGNFLGSFKLCTSAMYLLQSRPMLYTLTTMCTQLFCLSSQVYQPTGEQS